MLPAAFPNLLVNGATGIAVGMATNMAPHNLVEVVQALRHLITHPDADPRRPDAVRPRPRPAHRRQDRRPRRHPRRLRDRPRHASGCAPPPASRRSRRAARASSSPSCPTASAPRRSSSGSRRSCRPRSSRASPTSRTSPTASNGLRLVIEVKNGFVPEALLEQLYKLTPMEDSFGINDVALVDGQPRTLGPQGAARGLPRPPLRRRTPPLGVPPRQGRRPAAPGRGPAGRDPRHRRGHPADPLQRQRRARPGAADRRSST